MLESIFWVLVGALIGWSFPQPQWAANLKEKLWGLFTKR